MGNVKKVILTPDGFWEEQYEKPENKNIISHIKDTLPKYDSHEFPIPEKIQFLEAQKSIYLNNLSNEEFLVSSRIGRKHNQSEFGIDATIQEYIDNLKKLQDYPRQLREFNKSKNKNQSKIAINHPFHLDEHYRLFKYLNDNFHEKAKKRYTYIYDCLIDTKISIDEISFFEFCKEHDNLDTLANRRQQTANETNLVDAINSLRDTFNSLQ